MRPTLLALLVLAVSLHSNAQDAKTWLQSQNLEGEPKGGFQDFEAVVARVPGAKDAASAAERVVILKQGKPVWQSGPKDAEPGSRWTVHSLGRDLDSDGQPDVHFSSHGNAGQCCTVHHVYRLKPQVRKVANEVCVLTSSDTTNPSAVKKVGRSVRWLYGNWAITR